MAALTFDDVLPQAGAPAKPASGAPAGGPLTFDDVVAGSAGKAAPQGWGDFLLGHSLDAAKAMQDPLGATIGAARKLYDARGTIADDVSQIVSNAPESAKDLAKNIGQAAWHPLDTAKTIGKGLYGAGQLAGDAITGAVGLPTGGSFLQDDRGVARAIGQYYGDRLGTPDALLHTLTKDPVGLLMDASMGLGGAAKIAGMAGNVAGKIGTAARVAGETGALAGDAADVGQAARAAGYGGAIAGEGAGGATSLADRIANGAQGVASGLDQASSGLTAAGHATNPIALAAKGTSYVVGKAAPVAGNLTAAVLGNATGQGGDVFKQIADTKFGYGDSLMGGTDPAEAANYAKRAQTLADYQSGAGDMTGIVDQAKAALARMRAQRNAEYQNGMMGVRTDPTALDVSGIKQALGSALGTWTRDGIPRNIPSGVAEQLDLVQQYLDGGPQRWTPGALDNLKQDINGALAKIQPNTVESNALGGVHAAIGRAITEQAPQYAKVMSDYGDASDAIREIQQGMSLGQRQTADAALRKLQTIFRNNASTGYGNRMDMAKTLEDNGANTMLDALAGQSTSAPFARGIQGAVAGTGALGLAGGAAATGNLPTAAAALAGLILQSPKLMGKAVGGAAQGAGMVYGAGRRAIGALGSADDAVKDLATRIWRGPDDNPSGPGSTVWNDVPKGPPPGGPMHTTGKGRRYLPPPSDGPIDAEFEDYHDPQIAGPDMVKRIAGPGGPQIEAPSNKTLPPEFLAMLARIVGKHH